MGRWSHVDNCVAIGRDEYNSKIVDAHNADCDSYEARIWRLEPKALTDCNEYLAAMDDNYNLRAELARVKSESLRIVPDGTPCQPHELYPTQFVLRDSTVYVNAPGTRDLVDVTNNSRVAVPYDETVQPVRLERWPAC